MSSDSWMLDRLNWNTSLPCKTPLRETKHKLEISYQLYQTLSVFSNNKNDSPACH